VLDQPHQASTVRVRTLPRAAVDLEETEIKRIFGRLWRRSLPRLHASFVYFKDDSEELTPESELLLPEVSGPHAIARVGHQPYRPYGHHRNTRLQYQLSLRRARKVADLLAKQGVDRNILDIESHGEDNPPRHRPAIRFGSLAIAGLRSPYGDATARRRPAFLQASYCVGANRPPAGRWLYLYPPFLLAYLDQRVLRCPVPVCAPLSDVGRW